LASGEYGGRLDQRFEKLDESVGVDRAITKRDRTKPLLVMPEIIVTLQRGDEPPQGHGRDLAGGDATGRAPRTGPYVPQP
jgi:hypothetical protein